MIKWLLGALFLLAPSLASAQVVPSGQFTPGHTVRCQNSTCTVVVDGGGSAGSSKNGQGYLTELGITNTGTPFCINDALTNAGGGYHQVCLGANALGGGLISYNAVGGASPLALNFNINGSTFSFPGPGNGNVMGPTPNPPAGNVALWNGGLTLKDGGPYSPATTDIVAGCGAIGNGIADDTAAIQTCINGLPVSGGTITFPTNHTFLISATINIGNGSASAGSTRTGVVLQGAGNPLGTSLLGPNVSGTPTILYTGSGTAISVNGPLNGWGLQNLQIQCQQGSAQGILVVSASWADNRNLRLTGCENGISSKTVATMPAGYVVTDSLHNNWYKTVIELGNAGGAAVTLDSGSATQSSDTDFNIFDDLSLVFPNLGGGTQQGVVLRVTDNNIFRNVHFIAHGGTQTIQPWVFDYSVNNQFPAGNIIDGTDPATLGCGGNCGTNDNEPAGPSNFTNIGTPLYVDDGGLANRAKWNFLRNLQLTNNATPPINLPNLLLDHAFTTWVPVFTGSTSGGTITYTQTGGSVFVNNDTVTIQYTIGATQANMSSLVGNLFISALPVKSGITGIADFGGCFVMANGVTYSASRTMSATVVNAGSTNMSVFETGGTGSFGAMPVADVGGAGVLFAGTCTYHRGP